jgi:hypothetical protein
VIRRRTALAILIAALPVAPIASIAAQANRLQARFDAATYSALKVILDSARLAKLPVKLIEDNALEGASSGASGDTIIVAVRQFTKQLATAHATLGPTASPDELRAAVGAIDARIPLGDLKRIRRAAPKRSITTALTVFSDIAGRGVPIATSSDLVVSLLSHRVKDADLLTFGRWVRLDIEKGADPATAATARANGFITAAAGRGNTSRS